MPEVAQGRAARVREGKIHEGEEGEAQLPRYPLQRRELMIGLDGRRYKPMGDEGLSMRFVFKHATLG